MNKNKIEIVYDDDVGRGVIFSAFLAAGTPEAGVRGQHPDTLALA